MNARTTILVTLAAIALAMPQALLGSTRDWPQWRGPDHNLTSLGNGVFEDENFGLEVAWKRTLGSGYSSISVVGERAVTMFSDGKSDLLIALDAARGEELWRYEIASTYEGHDGSDDGPLGTPTIAGGVVYGLGPNGRLFAVRLADGEEIWSQQIDQRYGAVAPAYGFTTGPLLVDGLLVVQTGGPEGRSISALEPATGKLRWSAGDDGVGYTSPLPARFGGRRQILAVSNKHLLGLVPATGEVLWRYAYTPEENWDAQALLAGDDQVLVVYGNESALLRVAGGDDGFAVSELWRGPVLRNTSVMPVFYDGYLYGFSGRFLSCVDAKTGETVWKSRPPGEGGLVVVDGQLIILGSRGDLVIAAASPQGYVEKARLKVSDRESLSAPSFAGGRFFVRNLTEVASIALTDRPTAAPPAAAEAVELRGKFGEFVRRVRAAENPSQRIDEFMAKQKSFPIVEGDSLVHFVFRGDVADIAVAGNLFEMDVEEPLHRVADTDLYFRTYELTPGGHYEYHFTVFEERIADPLNPEKIGEPGEVESQLAMPGWEAPAHLREPEGERGRIEAFPYKSEILGNEREVQVYLPPGYDAAGERYPLVVVHYGTRALGYAKMTNTFDNLIGKRIAPIIAAFLPRVDFGEYGGGIAEFSEALARELLPALEARYRTLPGAENRAMLGIASGGFGSAYTALKNPDTVGKVGVQSFYFREAADELRAMISSGEPRPVEFYVEWSINDLKAQGEGGVQCRRHSRELAALLKDNGYAITTDEVVDAAGWGSWRSRTDRILETFFPLDD